MVVHRLDVRAKKLCAFAKVIRLVDAVFVLDTTVTIRVLEPRPDSGPVESGNMEFKPYQQVMADLAKQTPQPVPQATVRNQPVEIPGVFNQSLNMLKPVNTQELYKGRDR